MIDYTDGDFIANPVAFGNNIRECYSLFGFNRVYYPFLAIPGSPQRPSFSIQDHERTGFYLHDAENDVWGFSIFGFPCYLFDNGVLTLKNFLGDSVKLTVQTGNIELNWPEESGTIARIEDLAGFSSGGGGYRLKRVTPSGVIDNSNLVFTVTDTISHHLLFLVNGLSEEFSITDEYTFAALTAPLSNDRVEVIYTTKSEPSVEIPDGMINGSNTIFNLTPASPGLHVLVNGLGETFTSLYGTITLTLPPHTGDRLEVIESLYSISDVNKEIPVGLVDGSNTTFTLIEEATKVLMILINGLTYPFTFTAPSTIVVSEAPIIGDRVEIVWL